MSRVIKSGMVPDQVRPWDRRPLGGAVASHAWAVSAPLPPLAAAARAAAGSARQRTEALAERARAVLAEAEQEAAVLLAEARTEAAAVLRQAEEGVRNVLAEARRAGLAEGRAQSQAEAKELLAEASREAGSLREQGSAAAEAAREQAEEEARSLVAAVRQERLRILEEASSEIAALALAVAARVLRSELSLQPAAVVPMVAAALEKLRGEEQVRLRLSPDGVAAAAAARAGLQAGAGIRELELVADLSLAPGDFVVEAAVGLVDGHLDRQLAHLAGAITVGQQQP